MSITVTWYGHATIGMKVGEHQLLVDPFFTGNPAASTTADKVQADFILVSHGHGDHVGDAVAIAKRTGAMIISNNEIAGWVQVLGSKKTHGQHLRGAFKYPFGYLKLSLALHGSELPDGRNGGNPAGFLFTAEGKKIYFAGDTGFFL